MYRLSPSRITAALIIASLAAPCFGQNTELATSNAALLRKVEELERSLAAVKAVLAAQGAPAAPVAPVAAAPVLPASVAPAVMTADNSADNDGHTLGVLQFRGYSDFGFGRALFEKLPPAGLSGSTQSFTLGDFDLFVTSKISDHISVLGEMLITSDFTNEFGAEMDRLLLTYSVNKYLRISAGKFNTATGFYTNEFHRARFFQTATGRPLMYADEDNGGILPVHNIGLSVTGLVPSGPLGLHWVAELANGRASRDPEGVPVQNFVADKNGKAANFALYARPDWIHGLEAGVSFYRDRQYPAEFAALEQRIYTGHIALVQPHLELLAEAAMLHHKATDTHDRFNSVTSYAQASYQTGQFRPYVRYDYQNIPSSDPIFGHIGRRNGPTVGTRFDFSDFGCFKLQYGRLSERDGKSTNEVQAQIAIAF